MPFRAKKRSQGDFIDFAVIRDGDQVLTKRSERMRDLLNSRLGFAARAPHIWWGVSVEDRKYGVPRIGHRQAANANVRFLSLEPLLEDIGEISLGGIRWAIGGGESGMRARPFDIDWARSVLRQCREQQVACFVKHLGRRPISGESPIEAAQLERQRVGRVAARLARPPISEPLNAEERRKPWQPL